MANKMEAVLSFKLDDKGLKDAAKELEQLKKQLDALSKQRAQADTKTPAGKQQADQLDTRIAQTRRAIEAGEALMGQGNNVQKLQEAFQAQLKGRNPARMMSENVADAMQRAIKATFGDLGEAMKNPVTKGHFERLIGDQVENVRTQGRTQAKGKRAATQPAATPAPPATAPAEPVKPATKPLSDRDLIGTGGSDEAKKPTATRPSEAAPDQGPMADRKESGLPAYMKEQMDQNYENAKRMNLVDPIIQHAASGLTKKQITDLLANQMPGTDRSFLEDAVTAVRSRHSIPSNGALGGFGGGVVADFDPNEFPNWQRGYMERMGTLPAANQTQETGPGLLPDMPPTERQVRPRRTISRRGLRSRAKSQAEAEAESEAVAEAAPERVIRPATPMPAPERVIRPATPMPAPERVIRPATPMPTERDIRDQQIIDNLAQQQAAAARQREVQARKGKARGGVSGDIFGRTNLSATAPDTSMIQAMNQMEANAIVEAALNEEDTSSSYQYQSGPSLSQAQGQHRQRNSYKGKRRRFEKTKFESAADIINGLFEDMPEYRIYDGAQGGAMHGPTAADVKDLQANAFNIKKLQGLLGPAATNTQAALTGAANFNGNPADAAKLAEQIKTAYMDQKAVFGQATRTKGEESDAAISSASRALTELDAAAKHLKDTFVGSIKPTSTLNENLDAINKKAALQTEREDLLKRFGAEPSREQREQYARDLNTNAQRLQDYISDPAEKRALTKETNERNDEYGINQNVLNTFGQFLAGNVLLQTGRVMRQPYTAGSQAFNAYNQENQVDPGLLSQQRALQRGLIDMGGGMRSYELLKAQLGTSAVTSPFAAPAAAAGEVGGAAFGAAGSMLQTGASLQMAGNTSPWLNKALKFGSGATLLGGAALAGGALGMGLGSLLSPAFNNGKQKDPFQVLSMMIEPTKTVQDKTEQEIGGKVRVLQGKQLAQVEKLSQQTSNAFKMYDDAREQVDKVRQLQAVEGPRPSATTLQLGIDANKNLDKSKVDMREYAQQLAKAAGAGPIDQAILDDPEKLRGFVKFFENALDTTNFKKLLENNPQIKLQREQMRNQWGDFTVDMARQTFQLNQNYQRQLEDVAKTRSRTSADFNTQLGRLGVNRTRAAEDYAVANRDNDTQIARTRRSVNLQLSRQDEDYVRNRSRLFEDDNKSRIRATEDSNKTLTRMYRDVNTQLERTTEDTSRSLKRTQEDTARSVTRVQEDTARQWARTVEDTSRSSQRLLEDTTRSTARLVEDTTRTLVRAQADAQTTLQRAAEDRNTSGQRLMDDTATSRSRLAQDYNRTVAQQNRNFARSNQDLDQGYQDSVLGIVAPGLTSNPGYQLMKLTRDYAKNKSRLGEDYQTGRDDLNLSTDRQFEDLAKSLQRGIEDLNKAFERTVEDVNKNLERTAEDIATSLQRNAEDVSTSLQRSAEDITTTLARAAEDIATTIQRTNEDVATTLQRAGEDIATTLQRAGEDAAKTVSDTIEDVSTNFQRTMDDLNTALARATSDMDLEHYRNYQDAMTQLQDAEVDYQNNRAEIQRNYNRTIEDLNNAEFDLRRDYNRNIEDINTQAKRMAQDFSFASDQLKIETQRFQRDFENSLTQFTQSLAQAANSTVSAVQEALNAAIIDIRNEGANQKQQIQDAGNAGNSGGNAPGVPGLNGMDRIPKDEFPAMLHRDEMVVTKGEAEFLRQQGYRPEAKNLKEVIPSLAANALPQFLNGWNGGWTGKIGGTPLTGRANTSTVSYYDVQGNYLGEGSYDKNGNLPSWEAISGQYKLHDFSKDGVKGTPNWQPIQNVTSGGSATPTSSGGIGSEADLWNNGQIAYSKALEDLYDRLRKATTSDERAKLQTEGDSITAKYRSGGYNSATVLPGVGGSSSGGSTTGSTPFVPKTYTKGEMLINGQPSKYKNFMDYANSRDYWRDMMTNFGVSSGSQWRGGYQPDHGGVGQVTLSNSQTGTAQGLTSHGGSGIIRANNSIVPPSMTSRSYGSSHGNMSISVNITGGSAHAQAVANQAINAFSRDLSNRGLSIV